MLVFRLVLGAMLAVLFAFTAMVIANAGPDLFSVFFGDIARIGWPGQFDLDFMFMLGLSAFWVAWRHRFSAAGLGLAVLAFFGGSSFLGVYLIVQSLRCRGDVVAMLVGDRAGG
jgi:hypothetical protein